MALTEIEQQGQIAPSNVENKIRTIFEWSNNILTNPLFTGGTIGSVGLALGAQYYKTALGITIGATVWDYVNRRTERWLRRRLIARNEKKSKQIFPAS